LKRIFQFILSHSIFIAICAVGLVIQTFQLLHQPINYNITAFVFFATLCSYNFYWLVSKRSFSKVPLKAFINETIGNNLLMLLIALAGMLFYFFRSSLDIRNIIPAFILTSLYALPLLPIKSLHFTRKLGILKTVVLAFTWAYVTVCIPLNKPFGESTDPEIFILIRRFLFMLMLCIIFDSRDSAMDKIRGMHSLATDLSPRALKVLVIIVFIALFSTFLFHDTFNITLFQSIALQVSTLTLLVVFYLSRKEQNYFFYYFIVDGMMLFSAIATYIASI